MSQSTRTPTGGVSASVLIIVLVGLVSGAVFGVLLGQIIPEPALVSVIASFLAILVASAVRYFTISAGAGAAFPGGGPAAIPSVLLINSVIAWPRMTFDGSGSAPPSVRYGGYRRSVRRHSDGAADDFLLHGARRGF